jgi:predicted RNA-binding protein
MRYWLDLFTPYTWERFKEHGATISGFRPRQRKTAYQRIKTGDLLLCYLVKLSRWCGVLEVVSEAFEDTAPIFAEVNDPFPIRFKVKPIILLEFEQAIPIQQPEIWNSLSFTQKLPVGVFGWAQSAGLRQSLVEIPSSDGKLIVQAVERQQQERRKFPLDAADLRHIKSRTVVRTEKGEVEVEVPSREEEEVAEQTTIVEPEQRTSLAIQAKVARLGIIFGFRVWVPPSDRTRLKELLPVDQRDRFVDTLPLNYDLATLKTIENIDVIWLQGRSIAHAFEVEHTTAIYSGLLRMADLLAMQPNMNIDLHIVAPDERRDNVRREIVRPVFSVLEGGPMSGRCSFLPYTAVDEILAEPNLVHLRPSIIEDYEEYFDA